MFPFEAQNGIGPSHHVRGGIKALADAASLDVIKESRFNAGRGGGGGGGGNNIRPSLSHQLRHAAGD